MIKKGFQTGVVASLIAAVNVAWGAGAQLRGVHVAATPTGTQVILDLSATTTEKVFTLDHPERAVVDLGHTRMNRSTRLPLGAGVVSGFRIGTQPGGTLRFVMQLKSVTPTRAVWIQTPGMRGPQLVITLGDATGQAAQAASVVTPASVAV